MSSFSSNRARIRGLLIVTRTALFLVQLVMSQITKVTTCLFCREVEIDYLNSNKTFTDKICFALSYTLLSFRVLSGLLKTLWPLITHNMNYIDIVFSLFLNKITIKQLIGVLVYLYQNFYVCTTLTVYNLS